MTPQVCGGLKHLLFLLFFLLVAVFFFLAALFFFSAAFFAAVFLSGAGFLAAVFLFFGKFFFLGTAFFLGAAAFFSEAMRIFLNSGDSLYKFLIWMKSPEQLRPSNRIGRWHSTTSCLWYIGLHESFNCDHGRAFAVLELIDLFYDPCFVLRYQCLFCFKY